MTQPLKIGVLLSGSGTNLQALIDDIAAGTLNAEIVQVISSRPDAYGIERAQAAGIPVLVMNKTLYADAEAADAQIVEALQAAGAEYIVMAGYMRKVTPGHAARISESRVEFAPCAAAFVQGCACYSRCFRGGREGDGRDRAFRQ